MGWVTDEGEHDGSAAAIFADGRVSIGWDGVNGGVMAVRHPNAGTYDDEYEVLDARHAIGWVGICECGWRGPIWERVVSPDLHDLTARSVYVPDPDRHGDPPAEVEAGIHAEWRNHLPPATLTAIRNAAADLATAQGILTAAVARARRDGRSWAEIGAAAGVTRQAAHERWAHLDKTVDPADA